MQDRYQVSYSLPSRCDIDLFAVFDGHGSDKIAQFLSKNLAKYIDEELKIHKCPIDALKQGFK